MRVHRLNDHEQVHRHAPEQRADGDRLHPAPGHGAAIEGQQRTPGLPEGVGDGEDGFVQAAHHPFDIAAQVTVRMLGRLAAPAEHEHAHADLLLGQGVLQGAMTQPGVGKAHPGGDGPLTQPVEEHAALLVGGVGAGMGHCRRAWT